MSGRYIPCTVTNEYLQGAGVVIGAEGSHNDVYLRLTFGAMWDGLAKYVTFRDALGENPTVVMLLPSMAVDDGGDTYDVPTPAEAKAHQGNAMVTICGYTVDADGKQEETATLTATAYFRVLPADYAMLDDESITPTLAQQLQAEIEAQKSDILDARAAAKDAKRYADAAKDDAAAATGAATDAQESQEAAEAAKDEAEASANYASTAAGSAGHSAAAALQSEKNAADYEARALAYSQAAGGSANSAAGDAARAQTALQGSLAAQEAAEKAKAAAEEAEDHAASKSAAAVLAAQSADRSASEADDSATLAESYTHGGTGKRAGEDEDNAKYYMERARDISGGDFVTRTEFDTELAVVAPETIQAIKNGTYVPGTT